MHSIILTESVRGLGVAGSMVKAKPGYARFLIYIAKKAIHATAKNIADLQEKRHAMEVENTARLRTAQHLMEELLEFTSKNSVFITKQASEDGRLYGSVKARDIAELLKKDTGIPIQARNISIEGNVTEVGEYVAKVELHADVIVPVAFYVVRTEADIAKIQEKKAIRASKRDDDEAALRQYLEAENINLDDAETVDSEMVESEKMISEGGGTAIEDCSSSHDG